MNAVKEHYAHHRLHLLGCAAAGIAIILAVSLDAPVLAIAGGLFCATMMIGMVWMMFGMASGHRH